MKIKRRICVIGLGYIGLPTACLLAQMGHRVFGVDTSLRVLNALKSGRAHISEPDLQRLLNSDQVRENFEFSTIPNQADIFIIAVPTPFNEKHEPNIEFIIEAVHSIAPLLRPGNIVILESTSPVGTTEKIFENLNNLGVDMSEIFIAHCPERVLPGRIMSELVENDRIVGGYCRTASEKVAQFYREFVKGSVVVTDSRTAELCKLVENSYRDVNIAFANELSMISDKLDVDVWELIDLANHHPRVHILSPGVGVGGHCIAVDPWFIIHADKENAKLLKKSREVNLRKTDWVLEKILENYKNLKEKLSREPVIACFGLTFKPDVDDLRESPALQIYHNLLSAGIRPLAVEPNLIEHNSIYLTDYQEACKKADLIVILVPHKHFADIETDAEVLNFSGKG